MLAVRDVARGKAAAATLQRRTGNAAIDVVELDLASLASVRAAAEELLAIGAEEAPLRVIVANAGLQVLSAAHASEDGYELTFAVNHLGHFLLVRLLREALVAPARVVVVSSGTHYGTFRKSWGFPAPRWADPHELARPREGQGRIAYSTSKLANLYFAYELARRSDPARLTANAFDPGLMPATGLARDASGFQRFMWERVLPPLRHVVPGISSPEASGAALARLAVDPSLDGVTGRYYAITRDTLSSEASYDGARAEELWAVSEELVGLDTAVRSG